MNVYPIRSEEEYQAALLRIAALMDAAPGSAEADELDVLAMLVERFEDAQEPVLPPDPVEAVLFRLEQTGRTPKDLAEILGVRRNRVWEILNRKRRLTVGMAQALSARLGIPIAVLLQTGEPPPGRVLTLGGRGRESPRPPSRRAPIRAREPISGRSETPPPLSNTSLPDIVDAHLRAERNLDPDAADALGQMFRLAYEQFSKHAGSDAHLGSTSPEREADNV